MEIHTDMPLPVGKEVYRPLRPVCISCLDFFRKVESLWMYIFLTTSQSGIGFFLALLYCILLTDSCNVYREHQNDFSTVLAPT